jgi:hypothetical protein
MVLEVPMVLCGQEFYRKGEHFLLRLFDVGKKYRVSCVQKTSDEAPPIFFHLPLADEITWQEAERAFIAKYRQLLSEGFVAVEAGADYEVVKGYSLKRSNRMGEFRFYAQIFKEHIFGGSYYGVQTQEFQVPEEGPADTVLRETLLRYDIYGNAEDFLKGLIDGKKSLGFGDEVCSQVASFLPQCVVPIRSDIVREAMGEAHSQEVMVHIDEQQDFMPREESLMVPREVPEWPLLRVWEAKGTIFEWPYILKLLVVGRWFGYEYLITSAYGANSPTLLFRGDREHAFGCFDGIIAEKIAQGYVSSEPELPAEPSSEVSCEPRRKIRWRD